MSISYVAVPTIKNCSVTYFDCVNAELLLRVGLIHVCAVYRLVRYSCIYAACISPLMNVLCYSALNAVEICNEIMYDFYLGIPQMLVSPVSQDVKQMLWSLPLKFASRSLMAQRYWHRVRCG